MTDHDFVRSIRSRYDKCVCSSCAGRTCKLVIGALNRNYLCILDAGKYKTNYANNNLELCDFLIFYASTGIIACVAELKGGNIKPKKACNQIKEGAKLAEKLMLSLTAKTLFPLLMRNRRKRQHPSDYKIIRREKVRFQGVDYKIIILPSGSYLDRVFQIAG